ncbi:MAG TPA: hypothetical protein VLA95_07125 [Gemmatimonadales bacterium]|nr:hypothetical protein [Gemmatimonadales bacterium]
MRNGRLLLTLAAAGLAACGGGDRSDQALADSLSRDLQLVPAESTATLNDQPAGAPAPAPAATSPRPTAPRPSAPAPSQPAPSPARTLAAGTSFSATAIDSISSRHNKVGQTMTVRVASDVTNDAGRVVIPAGSVVTLRIAAIAPSENKSDNVGTLSLVPVSVAIGGTSHDLTGRVTSVESTLKGRGVTAGDAAKVGAGAAAGAAAGQVIGKKTAPTVIGAVVGAAAGAAIASQSADRDVVVASGAKVVIELTETFSRS